MVVSPFVSATHLLFHDGYSGRGSAKVATLNRLFTSPGNSHGTLLLIDRVFSSFVMHSKIRFYYQTVEGMALLPWKS